MASARALTDAAASASVPEMLELLDELGRLAHIDWAEFLPLPIPDPAFSPAAEPPPDRGPQSGIAAEGWLWPHATLPGGLAFPGRAQSRYAPCTTIDHADIEGAAMPGDVVIVYAGETPPPAWDASVFLAGPVPRSSAVPSWHPDAIEQLEQRWPGPGRLVVFAPEPRNGIAVEGTDSLDWEEKGLHRSDVVLFWIPRTMPSMPGLTTNIEWGSLYTSGRAVLGFPPDAVSVDYPIQQARANAVPISHTLEDTVANALEMIGAGASRRDGERDIPLLVWRTPSFRRWYAVQRGAGNTLVGARIEWVFRPGADRGFVLYWAAHVHVHVGAEDRVKDNEVVIARPDAAHVVLYRPAPDPDDTVIVLVREFRSPATAPDGFVHELPGGSSTRPTNPAQQAAAEVREETGLVLDTDRLRYHGSRQVAASQSAHHTHLFSASITETELNGLRTHQDQPYGDGRGSEQTWVEITTVADLHADSGADWATLGMIGQALRT